VTNVGEMHDCFLVLSEEVLQRYDVILLSLCLKADESVHHMDCQSITLNKQSSAAFICCADRRLSVSTWDGSLWKLVHTMSIGQVVYVFGGN
jgi:hypothetical protein